MSWEIFCATSNEPFFLIISSIIWGRTLEGVDGFILPPDTYDSSLEEQGLFLCLWELPRGWAIPAMPVVDSQIMRPDVPTHLIKSFLLWRGQFTFAILFFDMIKYKWRHTSEKSFVSEIGRISLRYVTPALGVNKLRTAFDEIMRE